jgi:flagellin-like hook-associated protein FlgL
MAGEISLSAAVRSSLLSLSGTENLISRTQNRLSSGLRVASPIDDAKIFFEAKALNDRGSDFNEKKDGIDQGISSLSTALEAVESIDSLVQQLKGLANAAKSASSTEIASIQTQFNELLTQIDNLAADASYQGLNLINGTGSTLDVEFSTTTTSLISVASVDLTTGTLGLDITSVAGLTVTSTLTTKIDDALAELDAGLDTLRANAQELGGNVALLQTRLDFTESYVNVLEEGAAKLTLANITEEGANLVALQTRQQLGISALAFAGQSEQGVLALFR